jgi:uncharacterized protein (DUF983 family)
MQIDRESVPMTTALLRGFRGRCPACGEGHLFGRYLKVNDHCAHCGEAYYHHRADDFPAYLVIVLVGHFIVPAILFTDLRFAPPLWVLFALFVPMVPIMTLGLLQPIKGSVVALQWRTGMHGFGGEHEEGAALL